MLIDEFVTRIYRKVPVETNMKLGIYNSPCRLVSSSSIGDPFRSTGRVASSRAKSAPNRTTLTRLVLDAHIV